jgi:hypothetical protein
VIGANMSKGNAEEQSPAEESKKDDDKTSLTVVDQPPKVDVDSDNSKANEMSSRVNVDADSGRARTPTRAL